MLLTLAALLMTVPAFAQTIDVSGKVTDGTGEPLIGVTVMVAGSNNGMATDIDGNYALKGVPSKGKLIFSYVGYASQTIEVKGRTKIDVTMGEDSQALEELVVVGYGKMKKSDLTGAISSVNSENVTAKGTPSVIEALQGSAPGVNITKSTGRANGGFDVEIRGKSSINSDTKPLYVVDGVMCSDIDFLNPQDIERIDVLKDASSTAIYGSRATAGVIIVTTKGGTNVKKGTKATVTYDGYYGINRVARQPDYMDGTQFARFRIQKFIAPVIDPSYTEAQPIMGIGQLANIGQAYLSYSATDLSQGFVLRDMIASGNTYDWPNLVTQDGHQQNHYVGVSGASETANYHFGLGYNEEEGIYSGDESKNYSFKGSVDARINKVISAGFTANLSRIDNGYAYDSAIADAYKMNPFMVPYDEDGNIIRYPGNKNTLGTDGNQFSDQVSALYRMQDYKKEKRTYRALGNVWLQLDIIKGLNVKTTFSPSYTNYRESSFTGYIDPDTGYTYGGADPNSEGWNSSYIQNYTNFSWVWDNMVNFNRTFAEDHSVNFMGLFSMEKSATERYYMNTTDVMENTDWWNVGSGTPVQSSKASEGTSSSYTENSMISYALRLNYDYRGKYYLTGTVRWDGSSKFAKGHKWGSFPSIAVGWNIAEEEFLQKTWLNNLKIRASYGVTGNNAGIDNYATIVGISGPVFYPIDGTYLNGYYPGSIVNADLRWEKSNEFNIGLDFGFLNNRINGSIEWYNKKSKDLLYTVDLPLETGGGSMTTNVGSVRNQGIEVSLTTLNITNRTFEWNTTLTFSHNDNKVLEINGSSDQVLNGSKATGNLFVGSPYNNVYSYIYEGVVSDKLMTVPNHQCAIDNGFTPGEKVVAADYYFTVYGLAEGQPIIRDVNGDGEWTPEEDRVVVSSQPKFVGSLTSNMTYTLPKKWGMIDFSFNIYARIGGQVFSPFMGDRSYQGSYYCTYNDRGLNKLMRDFYIPQGALVDVDGIRDDGTLINPTYQTYTYYGENPYVSNGSSYGLGKSAAYYQGHAQGIVNASYAKVKYITLGYTFNNDLLKYIGCKSARLYFTVTNPFVFTKYKGFDPEWMTAELKNDGPSTISYQIGASIQF